MNVLSRIMAIDITTSVEIKKDYIRLVQPSRTDKKCWQKAYISKTMALYETHCASYENSTDTVFCIIVSATGCPRWKFPQRNSCSSKLCISDPKFENLKSNTHLQNKIH